MNLPIKLTATLCAALFLFISCTKPVRTSNNPPVAKAGPDQTIILPKDSVELNGTGTDADGKIEGYYWTKVSGPSSFILVNPNAAATKIKNLSEGVYEFVLSVKDDKGDWDRDTLAVFVINQTPLTGINCQLIPVGILSKKRSSMGTASAGNKIFFAGGEVAENEFSKRVDIYDLSTQTWSTAELSEGRAGTGAVAVGNKILFGGGGRYFDYNYSSKWKDLSTRVDIYDVVNNNWSTTELPEAQIFLGNFGVTAAIADKAFFYCGYEIFITSLPKSVWIYNVPTNTWSSSRLSENDCKNQAAGVSIENKLLIAGGHLVQGFTHPMSRIVDIYDASTGTWFIDSLSVARDNLKAATLNSKVFFAGGAVPENKFSKRVDIYDNATNTWSIDSLSRATILAGAASAGQKVFFFGDKQVDVYDAVSQSWTIAELPASVDMNEGSAIISAGGNIYISNGEKVWRFKF